MGPQLYLLAVAVGSALVGLWLAVRLERLAPQTAKGAGLCFLLAWLLPGVAAPLFVTAGLYLPAAFALLGAVFPVLVATFALTAWTLRYVADLAGNAFR